MQNEKNQKRTKEGNGTGKTTGPHTEFTSNKLFLGQGSVGSNLYDLWGERWPPSHNLPLPLAMLTKQLGEYLAHGAGET